VENKNDRIRYNAPMEVNWIFTVLLIAHLGGVIIGAGAALMTDLIFFNSMRDGILSRTELRFMRMGSITVVAGLLILLVTGIGLFLTNPLEYLSSDKFLAKMTVVGVLILNGIVVHIIHLPRMFRHADEFFLSSDEFMRNRHILFACGAISGTSWLTAFVFAGLPKGVFEYGELMLVYAAVLIVAVALSVTVGHYLGYFHKHIAPKDSTPTS
jgi:hypothetical protein